MNLDGNTVSWRFKPLRSNWPFVMITSPADERLSTFASSLDRKQADSVTIRARAWSVAGIQHCRCRLDRGPWTSMNPGGRSSHWTLTRPAPENGFELTVEVEDVFGALDTETIRVPPVDAAHRAAVGKGSDADAIAPWPEKHLLGTQLGPNRNGRQW